MTDVYDALRPRLESFYTYDELARLLRTNVDTLRGWKHAAGVSSVRQGKRWVIDKDGVIAILRYKQIPIL